MLRTDEILSTIEMLHAEHLDVRTVTLALNLNDCCRSRGRMAGAWTSPVPVKSISC